MDPLLDDTLPRETTRRLQERSAREKAVKQARSRSRIEQWAWTEVPAYRLGLLLGYACALYFGVSAFVAGVPAFNVGAPSGWTPIWASILILAGPVGVIGIMKETPTCRKIELYAAAPMAGALVVYAGTLLFIAYGVGDLNRVAVGSGFAWLAVPPVIRMLWLIAKIAEDRKIAKNKGD